MLRRTITTMSVLTACGLGFSVLQSSIAPHAACIACTLEATDGDDPGVRRPDARADRVSCTLKATDGVGDLGEIDQSGSGDDLIDLSLDTFSSDLCWMFNVQVTIFWVRETSAPNAYFHPGTFPSLRPTLASERRLMMVRTARSFSGPS